LLAAGLSHHIRNSLVAVKTFLDLAPAKLQEESLDLTGLRNPEFWKDYYQNVQSQIEKINNMLKDLWAASEAPVFAFKDEVSVRDTVSRVLDRLKASFAARNITIRNEIPDSLPLLHVDKPKFDRLFELLLKDEVVSLPAGGEIVLSGSPILGAKENEADVEIQLRDNGPGLPKEALRLIFDPFVVRSDSPMEYGINLMACYFIVHHHGGRIEASGGEGNGTTFTIRLLKNPNLPSPAEENQQFLQKVLLNEALWEKLLMAA
jgi:two-component system, probable response regulator PhcQ